MFTSRRKLLIIALLIGVIGVGLVAMTVSAAPAAQARVETFDCRPVEVADFGTQLFVRCSLPYNNSVQYFAIPNTIAPTDRYMMLMIAAVESDRLLRIRFDPTDVTTGASFGCNATTCRVITGLILLNP